ncbi:MAG TPA: endonuclease/exonuclease/phosphatase family protein [Urbifossiella sp.]|nr:endonuclease/exonuclease/phosphatase family protein [Urbifossiella sp.]
MANVSVMSWNIENFGQGKFRTQMTDVVANVIFKYAPVVVAIMEVRSNIGAQLGTRLCTTLAGLDATKTAKWDYQASPQYGTRLEQYLWLWRSDKVAVTKTQFKDTWPVSVTVGTKKQIVNLGFPRQKTTDHPPYLGFFTFKNKAGVPMSVLHAPGPSYMPNVVKAVANQAQISDFTGAAAGALMGDFNISPSDPAGGNGLKGFGPVVALGYVQKIVNTYTSLNRVPAPDPNLTTAQMFSSQFDNLLLKPTGAAAAGDVIDVVDDAIKPLANGNAGIANALRTWAYFKVNGTAGKVTAFANVYEGFASYRKIVSDHFPVIVDVNWG